MPCHPRPRGVERPGGSISRCAGSLDAARREVPDAARREAPEPVEGTGSDGRCPRVRMAPARSSRRAARSLGMSKGPGPPRSRYDERPPPQRGPSLWVDLSDCDSENWVRIMDYLSSDRSHAAQTKPASATTDYEVVDKICQVQRWLTSYEIADVVTRFRDGRQSMAALAKEYGCARKTISGHLKKAGLAARDNTCAPELVDQMVALYQRGMSLERAGQRLGVSGSTVRNYLLARGVPLRDTQGRDR